MSMKLVDVYLDTGVSVSVPDSTDVSTEEGLRLVKDRAKEQFARVLNEGGFSIQIGGEYDSGDEVVMEKGEPHAPPSVTINTIEWNGDAFRIVSTDGETIEGLASELL